MRKVAYLFFALSTLASCGNSGSRFHLEGKFQNINQGEFYLCDLEQGRKDTVILRDGQFVIDREQRDTAVLTLIFPNFSELPIIAEPGSRVKIKGDVSHLKETEVKGTDANEQMTAFRMQTNELMPPEVKEKAAQFIEEHPESPVCEYLLRRYFILSVDDDYEQAYTLFSKMLEARPLNVKLVQLQQRLANVRQMGAKGKLPSFSAKDTDGKTVSDSLLNKQLNVIFVWASWSYDSQNMLRRLDKSQKEHKGKLGVVSICLDAAPCEGSSFLERDSIIMPNICDGLMWDSPVLATLGIAFVPDNIVTDKDGNIIGRSMSNGELLEEIEKLKQK
jgi:hypothetical protein